MTHQILIDQIFGKPTPILSRIEMEKGASSRRYFRLSLDAHPKTMVQMVLPSDAMKSEEASANEQFEELPFVNVQRHLSKTGLPVPTIYLDATEEGHVFLEDLGGKTFNSAIQGKTEAEIAEWYNAAVDLLCTMHDKMWPIPATCYAAKRQFDYALLRWELDHYREWGVESRLGVTLPEDVRGELDHVFDDFAAKIDALPKGFVHRDYQSRNLMVKKDAPAPDSLSIIDFQDALVGPRTYDMVALLNDSYVDLSPGIQDALIQRYASNRNLPYEEIRREFDLITVQRKLKDGGRFIFIDQVKKDSSFLPFVAKSFDRVKKALGRLSGQERLKAILHRVDPATF